MANATRRGAPAAARMSRGFLGATSVLAAALMIALASTPAAASGSDDPGPRHRPSPLTGNLLQTREIPFADVKLIIEHNATAEDTGFQVFLDGEPWNRLNIERPDGRPLLEIRGLGPLRTLGLTELFFETSEPANADVPIEELLARFPEGDYEFDGVSVEGHELIGTARLTHTIPKGPEIRSPADGAVVDPANTVIRWNRVTESITGSPVEIVGYEVIVAKPVDVQPPGFSKPVLSVHLSASATRLTVPREFLAPATEYEFEVLALEVGGNQTISAGRFVTR